MSTFTTLNQVKALDEVVVTRRDSFYDLRLTEEGHTQKYSFYTKYDLLAWANEWIEHIA